MLDNDPDFRRYLEENEADRTIEEAAEVLQRQLELFPELRNPVPAFFTISADTLFVAGDRRSRTLG